MSSWCDDGASQTLSKLLIQMFQRRSREDVGFVSVRSIVSDWVCAFFWRILDTHQDCRSGWTLTVNHVTQTEILLLFIFSSWVWFNANQAAALKDGNPFRTFHRLKTVVAETCWFTHREISVSCTNSSRLTSCCSETPLILIPCKQELANSHLALLT